MRRPPERPQHGERDDQRGGGGAGADEQPELVAADERVRQRRAAGGERAGVIGRDRADGREPNGPRDVHRQVDERGGDPGVRRRDVGHRHGDERGGGKPAAGADQQERHEHGGPVAPAGLDLGEHEQPAAHAHEAGDQHGPGAEAGHEPRGRAERERRDHERLRQERGTASDGAIAEDALEVERADVERGEQAGGEEAANGRGAREAAQPQHPRRHDRVDEAALARGEQRCERQRRERGGERGRRDPASFGCLDDGEHADHRRGRDESRAEPVDAVGEADARGVVDERPACRQRQHADRHVDEEDPVPGDGLGQHPAGEEPERAAADRDEHVEAHRARALLGRRVLRRDDRQDDGGGERAAEPLHRTRGDEDLHVLRQPAGGRGGDEEREPAEDHALAADEIAEAPRDEQERAEDDEVAVEHPGQCGLTDIEVALDDGDATFTIDTSTTIIAWIARTVASVASRRWSRMSRLICAIVIITVSGMIS
jgi:hypothetical protein